MADARCPPIASRQSATLSLPLRRVSLVLAVLILLTTSFDIFLVINAGGNFRFCQIVSVLLLCLGVIKIINGTRTRMLASSPLCIWFLFQILFIPATAFWPKSAGYCLWLALNLGLIYSFVQLFSADLHALRTILRWYLYSFGIIAAFGMIQFALPLLGFPAIFVKQWWIAGSLPRVNGFSYEPSYFASYLLIGFVFAGSLRRAHSNLLPARMLLGIYCLTATGIVISSSRMGIVFLLVDVFLSQVKPWLSFISDFRRFRVSSHKVKPLFPSLISLACLSVLLGAGAAALRDNPSVMLMLLNGTGVSDTAAHSVIQREDSLEETITVFLEHPLVGRSLGGISSAIADREGETIHSFEDSKEFEGMSVFAEILAASGVIGFIPFVWFLVDTVRRPLKLAYQVNPFYSSLLRALVRSLVFAWAILQFNQNVLRPYLWAHLAILLSVYAAAQKSIGSGQARCRVAASERTSQTLSQ